MKDQRNILLTIFVTVFIDLLGFGIALPTLTPIFLNPHLAILPLSSTFGMRTLALGFLVASYPLAQFFGAPILGALSDHHGRKKILLISLLGTLAGYLLLGFGVTVNALALLFLGRIVDGFTGGNISTALSAIADVSDFKSRAKNFGLIGMAFGLGFILGPYVGGKLSDPHVLPWFNFATPFWFAALLCGANILLMLWRFPETLKTRVTTPVSFTTGFRNLYKASQLLNLRTMFLVVFFLIFGFSFFIQFFQVFLIDKFHFNQGQIGDLLAYVGFWAALSQGLLTRPLSRKFAPPQILSLSLLFLSLALPLLLLPSQARFLFFIVPFVAMANGLTQPNSSAIVSGLAGPESQGEVLGIQQSIQSLAMAIPPIISGFIVSINRNLPIGVAGLSIFTAWIIFVLFFKRQKREAFHEV